jgi:Family of unknown function (DUF6062)
VSPTPGLELEEVLRQAGCPICALALRAVGRSIQTIAYEQVNDPAVRDQLRSAGGFCQAHAYRWLREARNVLGTALIYRDLLGAMLTQLGQPVGDEARAGSREPGVPGTEAGLLGGLLRSRGRRRRPGRRDACLACRAQHEAEDRYLGLLLDSLAEPAFADAFGRSAGLCYVHTLAAARRGGPAAAVVVQRSRDAAEDLIRELGEVIRKEDYRFRAEPRTEAETTAPRRAVAWAVAAEGLTPPT